MGRPLSARIARHLHPWREGPWPLPWQEVFGREAPLAVEVGFGNGAYLADAAAGRPDRDHVGIEVSWTSVTHLFRRLEARGLDNVRALLGDARTLLELGFAPGSLEAVLVNHPCPWPKARHEGRRLVDERFLELAARRLVPGGRLLVVTDHEAYAAWVAERLAAQPWFVSSHPAAEVAAIPGRTPTKYEAKALRAGGSIHYFEWEKRAEPGPPPPFPHPDPPERRAMLSLTLRGPLPAPERLLVPFEERLHRETHDGVAVVVRLVAAYRALGQPLWLVEALVKEDELLQELALQLYRRADDTLLVKLATLGQPLPTYGVKRAVALVAELVRERAPELEVVHDNLGLRAGA